MRTTYDKNYNNKLDHLIPKISKKLFSHFWLELGKEPEFQSDSEGIDTSPLLNMTNAIFISTLLNILNAIKTKTIGEVELIKNIELSENAIKNVFKDLPFIIKVETVEIEK